MTLDRLFEIAAGLGIEIDDVQLSALRAMSFPEGWIAIDRRKFRDDTEYKCALAHEIGHVETGSFYNVNSCARIRHLHERHANRWAAELLVPLVRLQTMIQRGILVNQTLARLFDVTVEFIAMVLELYEKELCAIRDRRLPMVILYNSAAFPTVHARQSLNYAVLEST